MSDLFELIVQKIAQQFCHRKSVEIQPSLFRLVQHGKELVKFSSLKVSETLYIELRGSLKGGKGGFGSLLRSVKPKAQQDDNYEACRDLSGRRLRHINNERRIREFQERQEEEEKYVQEELKEYEAKKKQIKGAIDANNYKLDESYVRQVAHSGQEMVDSVRRGAAAAAASARKAANDEKRMGVDGGCQAKRTSK